MRVSSKQSAVLATVCDRRDVDSAKRMFAAAIGCGRWAGDLCLLTDGLDDNDRNWFTSRGIPVRTYEPIIPPDRWSATKGRRYPSQIFLLKYHLFTEAFREWNAVVYLDTDIFIHGPLDHLACVKRFSAVPDAVVFQSRLFERDGTVADTRSPAFNAGVFAFSPLTIPSDAFQRLVEITEETLRSSLFTDQSVLNLYFGRSWKRLPMEYNSLVNYYHRGTSEWIDRLRHRARIVHFAGPDKPSASGHPLYGDWLHILNRADDIIGEKSERNGECVDYSSRFLVGLAYRYLRGIEILRSVYRLTNRWIRTGARSSVRFVLNGSIGRSSKRRQRSQGFLSSRARPRRVNIDVSTECQLQCVGCPNSNGGIGANLGLTFMSFDDYRRVVSSYRRLESVELSNWGEPLLNPQIVDILRWSWEQGIEVTITNGSNLNYLTDDVADALVRYRVKHITCSIDGAGQETYGRYRAGGNFDVVMKNIEAINRLKKFYRTGHPALRWQFIAFSHNESDIPRAAAMARELEMEFIVKTPWDDLYGTPSMAPASQQTMEQFTGYMSRSDACEHPEYLDSVCMSLWRNPQVNADGRILGCPVNFWGDYGNGLESSLPKLLNSSSIRTARRMLMGLEEPVDGIPCTECPIYAIRRSRGFYISPACMAERLLTDMFHRNRRRRRRKPE